MLGDTGLSAYFGMTDSAKPRAGCVLISGAGGAVGTIAGQIAKLSGAQVVPRRLTHEGGLAMQHSGYDAI